MFLQKRRLFGFALLFLCLLFLQVQTVKSFLAHWFSVPVENVIRFSWEGRDPQELGLTDTDIKNYADKASKLQPANAQFWLNKGDSSADKQENIEQYINVYRHAIQQEPAKAQLWLKLALAKAGSNEFDQEFYLAYQRSFEYGGWEYFINRDLMRMGLYYWVSIDVAARTQLKKVVRRLYKQNTYQTLLLAKSYGQLRMACIWVRGMGKENPICRKVFRND